MPVLRVRRDDLTTCELLDEPAPDDAALQDGEALLRVERFALTANNVTYGALGDMLGYWKLFPDEDGWGRVPAWGYARVAASRAPGVAPGARVAGLVPMGDHLVVRPQPSARGFTDTSEHRAGLAAVYNAYAPAGEDDGDAILLMRPLFGTAVVLDLALADDGFDGAGTVVLTSASSRTAYALAHLLRERPVRTVGLTSPQRVDWVRELGLYDEVRGYDEAGALQAPDGAVLVDFAGDRSLLRTVHAALGDALRRSVIVGITHWQAEQDADPLPGPEPALFFAPTEIAKRGGDLGRLFGPAWEGFAPVLERSLTLAHVALDAELPQRWRDLAAGRADPAVGLVVQP